MAELIVTKKEIGPQLKKSAGTSRARPKIPGAGSQQLPLTGRHGAEHWILWFLGSGALMAAGFSDSVWTPVEGKIGADTAAGHKSFKAIRRNGGTGRAKGAVTRWAEYGLLGKLSLLNGSAESRIIFHQNLSGAFWSEKFSYQSAC